MSTQVQAIKVPVSASVSLVGMVVSMANFLFSTLDNLINTLHIVHKSYNPILDSTRTIPSAPYLA